MAAASRLDTLYRLIILYGHSLRYIRIIEKDLRHFRHLQRIHDVINILFLRNFAVFGYDKCQEKY